MEGRLGEHHGGSLHRDGSDARAASIISEEVARLDCTNDDLQQMRRNDPRKLALAAPLRKETTLPIKAIAALVYLSTSKTANATLHRFMTSGGTAHKSNEVAI